MLIKINGKIRIIIRTNHLTKIPGFIKTRNLDKWMTIKINFRTIWILIIYQNHIIQPVLKNLNIKKGINKDRKSESPISEVNKKKNFKSKDLAK